jgi:hypothetical protein
MITSAEKASDSVGSKPAASESSSRAYLSKSRVGLAERDRAVAVEIGPGALGQQFVVRAVEGRLCEEHEVAGLLQRLAVGQLQVERHRVLGILPGRAGVDDRVVVGEGGDARHDPLHLLVGRVGSRVGGLRVLEDGGHLLPIRLEQRRVVEAGRLGELVIGPALFRELGRLGGERLCVLAQVCLDRSEIGAGAGRVRRFGAARIVVAAGGCAEGGHGDGEECHETC